MNCTHVRELNKALFIEILWYCCSALTSKLFSDVLFYIFSILYADSMRCTQYLNIVIIVFIDVNIIVNILVIHCKEINDLITAMN